MEAYLAGASLGVIVFAVVLAIAWVVMPFAIIGTKPILRDLLKELKEKNRLLRETKDLLGTPTKPLYVPGASKE
jgi:hypothetical protein